MATRKPGTRAKAPSKPKPRAKPTAPAKPASQPNSEVKTSAPAAPSNVPPVFDQAVAFVLQDRIEGGYVNDPRDPGGETNFGISKRVYPKININSLTREDAVAIYRRDYWERAGCDDLPPKLAVAAFDCAVNQGVGIAGRLMQKALKVKADGVVGPVTIEAAKAADIEDAVVQFLGWRLRRYAFTANAATYMRGWSNRILHLQNFLNNDFKELSS